ncbi:hypothetical protein Nepgr_024228 [Nepenthes gracilis]|uniref:Uncharacterized protein n=1 Tax=Nepenthes gracilis TaxID=150966 RepID=A0AAD3T2Q4_NEPGR|nr:hypothetical protein Nepgr_024228 [Nepenthes gracilis]
MTLQCVELVSINNQIWPRVPIEEMTSLANFLYPTFTSAVSVQIKSGRLKSEKFRSPCLRPSVSPIHTRHLRISSTKSTLWEPSHVTYAPTDESDDREFLEATPNIFESPKSENLVPAPVTNTTEEHLGASNKPLLEVRFLKWPMWVFGPSLLLTTGMVPTLWLPLSSIYLGPNVASLLSLIGLDCIFNLGATLFLLMADFCARSGDSIKAHKSEAPFSYRFWNTLASVAGFIIPLALFVFSQNGLPHPEPSFISMLLLLGPYFMLLSVQMLTELLTWHWQSPVWLVVPIVYGVYRVLQLMRGLKLSLELSSPAWLVHTVRGLACWWVLILGLQLMRVAWFAGFAAEVNQRQESADAQGG